MHALKIAGSAGSSDDGWIVGLDIGLAAALLCLICIGWQQFDAYNESRKARESQQQPSSGAIIHVNMLGSYRPITSGLDASFETGHA